jgi:hypothetical protein
VADLLENTTPGPWDRQDNTIFALDETGTVNRFSAAMSSVAKVGTKLSERPKLNLKPTPA